MRRHLTWAAPAAAGLVLAVIAGWAAHYIPISTTSVAAEGSARNQAAPAGLAAAAGGTAGASGAAAGVDPATTAFRTACGELLDVVPVSAVAAGTAVEITLELHPVCPTGEWVASSAFNIRLTDTTVGADTPTGSTVAEATFDLGDERLFVPGYGDPASRIIARFDTGTAWADPDTLSTAITNGTVLVACEALDDHTSTPAGPGDVTAGTALTVETSGEAAISGTDESPDPEKTALAALRRQAASDDPYVAELEGAWVPQLSSKKKGTYDDYEGHTYSLADIYQQFLALRLKYPNVRLLNSSDWNSYTYPGYWVTIAGVAYSRPGQPNGWCGSRNIPPSQCFAKRLIRDGAPDGTTRHRD